MPARFYPDVNVVHKLRSTWTPAGFDQRAAVRGVVLALGPHVIYELARGFVARRSLSDVRAACSFLVEIKQVEYLPPLQAMIAAEFDEAMTGVPIITVLTQLNRTATRLELARLACGYGEQAAAFIARREADIQENQPNIARTNTKLLRRLRGVQTFDEFRSTLRHTGAAALMDLAKRQRIPVRPAALSRVSTRPDDFPVLTAWLNAQWHLAWVAAHHRRVPASDKLDDFRHLLESARCDAFVTEEGKLLKVGSAISPWRPCLAWDDLRARLA